MVRVGKGGVFLFCVFFGHPNNQVLSTPDFSEASGCPFLTPRKRGQADGAQEECCCCPLPGRGLHNPERQPSYLLTVPRQASFPWAYFQAKLLLELVGQSMLLVRRCYWTLGPSMGVWKRKYWYPIVGLGTWKLPFFHHTNANPSLWNSSPTPPSLRRLSDLPQTDLLHSPFSLPWLSFISRHTLDSS